MLKTVIGDIPLDEMKKQLEQHEIATLLQVFEPRIVYLDTFNVQGCYVTQLDKIELSRYLVKYPVLHKFVLKHELKHCSHFHLYAGFWRLLWETLKLDFKDNMRLEFDDALSEERLAFKKEALGDKESTFFRFMYVLSQETIMLIRLLLTPVILIKRLVKRVKDGI